MKTAIGAMILACALAPALRAQPVNGVAAPPNPSNPVAAPGLTPGTSVTIGVSAPVSPILSSGTGTSSLLQGATGFTGVQASSGAFGGMSGVTAQQQALISVQESLNQTIAPNGVSSGLSGPSGGGANGIGLTINGDRIIMTGTVHTEEQRQTLGAKANAAANGVPVDNELIVR